MKGIYNSIPETNRAPKVYSVAGIPQLQFVAQEVLFPTLNLLIGQ